MSNYDKLYEIAADNYGLVSRAQAHELGVSDKELSRLNADGRLTRLGYGVYRVKHHVIGELDPYADTVMLAGPDAYLYGESVLAMLDLCPTNPTRLFIASPRRVRRTLPEGTRVIRRSGSDDVTMYEGIPSQSVEGAIRSCMRSVMPERLAEAARKAMDRGYIYGDAAERLLKELEDEQAE